MDTKPQGSVWAPNEQEIGQAWRLIWLPTLVVFAAWYAAGRVFPQLPFVAVSAFSAVLFGVLTLRARRVFGDHEHAWMAVNVVAGVVFGFAVALLGVVRHVSFAQLFTLLTTPAYCAIGGVAAAALWSRVASRIVFSSRTERATLKA